MTANIFTEDQANLLRARCGERGGWRMDERIEQRRRVAKEFQEIVGQSGVREGREITKENLARLINLQWRVQNLNAIQIPSLLGLYAYKVYCGDFRGSRKDLEEIRFSQSGTREMHEGAPIDEVSKALADMATEDLSRQSRGAALLLEQPGAGRAIVSGFLHLLHPDRYGIVNRASTAVFEARGKLPLSKEQRRRAESLARDRAGGFAESLARVVREILRWQVAFDDVRWTCGLSDFHEVDQLLWDMGSKEKVQNPEALVQHVLATADEDNAKIRRKAESKARSLIESNLGHMTREQFRELFTLLNTCQGSRGVLYSRFSPGFMGAHANVLLESMEDLNPWVERLWKATEEKIPVLLDQFLSEKIPAAERLFPSVILYLRDPESFAPWTKALERAMYKVQSGLPSRIADSKSYLEYCAAVEGLRREHGFPAELKDWVLSAIQREGSVGGGGTGPDQTEGEFQGLSEDTFRFLEELSRNNSEEWFGKNEPWFRKVVHEPFRALLSDLASKVITSLDPGLETRITTGKVLCRLRKNIWGPRPAQCFNEHYWGAFYRRDRKKQTDAQLFVGLRPWGLQYGFYLGSESQDVKALLITALEKEKGKEKGTGQVIFAHIQRSGFLLAGSSGEREPVPVTVADYDGFLRLARDARLHVYRRMDAAEVVKEGSGLVGRIRDDFKSLYPLFKLATEGHVEPGILKLMDNGEVILPPLPITRAILAEETFLDEPFFQNLDSLLQDKRQLIFDGPPGTGKTFVALKYAEYLTQEGGKYQTVQFHPSYGYEDFVEGLRPTSESGQLTYRVEDGVFKRLCEEARLHSLSSRYVLVIDEINRGNLPRIFGELLFLLERRDQTAFLPYSKMSFSIPGNVFLLGTMNTADRSIALLDLAVRRRFHFVRLEPSTDVLQRWLQAKSKPLWVRDVLYRLNAALVDRGVGEERLIGHAHFMSAQLDDDHLETIWKHSITPLLEEYFFAKPEVLREFSLERFQRREAMGDESSDEDAEALA